MKALILAAGTGSRLMPLTKNTPKSLVKLNGKPMIEHILKALEQFKLEEFVIVTGYLHEKIETYFADRSEKVKFIYNDRYNTAGNCYSMLVAEKYLAGSEFFKIDSDLIFSAEIAANLLAVKGDVRVTADVKNDMGAEEMKIKIDNSQRIVDFSKEIPPKEAWGESIGIEFLTSKGGRAVFTALKEMMETGKEMGYYEEAYGMVARNQGIVTAVPLPPKAPWIEIDNQIDLKAAHKLFAD
ncbi:MAG: phosphocholine cytidylyltransferase family protein [Deltaproteobacteria bacterium]|jgi:choline kinase|nr:phosphocholine cytidylyltransferase family protein [Deltaproteobacteria bacterium]